MMRRGVVLWACQFVSVYWEALRFHYLCLMSRPQSPNSGSKPRCLPSLMYHYKNPGRVYRLLVSNTPTL